MEDPPLPALTVRQVAALLNVNEKTVYRLAQRRDLPGFKVAGAWRFQQADIDLWIDGQKALAAANTKPGLAKARRASQGSRKPQRRAGR